MSKIKLIATDIDGTILKYNFEFNQAVKDCIKSLTKEGVKVVLITGRMHCATTYVAEELGLDTPIVSYQGGLVKDGDKILYERYLDPQKAREIIDWAKQNNVHLNLYMDDKLYVEKDDAIIQRYTKERRANYIVKPFAQLELKNINKMLVIDFDNADKVTEYKEFLENKFSDIEFVKSMPFFCEICNPEATKFHAISFLTKYWNLDKSEVMTIGDQDNDINLLKAGGVKVAMGNATDALKAVADYVTDTVNNDGFVKAVERFVYGKVKL